MKISELESKINLLKLDDDDVIWNIRMPDKSCEICGGHGIKAWDGEDSVLCECLYSTDSTRELMPFVILRGLHNLKRRQVYDE